MAHRWMPEDFEEINGRLVLRTSKPRRARNALDVMLDARVKVDKFDSKTEFRYDQQLAAQKHGHDILDYAYHPFSLRLPGHNNYWRPDFIVRGTDRTIEIHEVKGKILPAALVKIKVAADVYSWLFDRIVIVVYRRNGWNYMEMAR